MGSDDAKKKQASFVPDSPEWVKNGRRMIQLKSLHGVFGFEVQRYKSAVSGQEQSYLELSQQFEADHLSAGLRELIGYYSNRLSYSEVAQLVKRVSGTAIVSDQKAEQVVIATAEAISQLCAKNLTNCLR